MNILNNKDSISLNEELEDETQCFSQQLKKSINRRAPDMQMGSRNFNIFF